MEREMLALCEAAMRAGLAAAKDGVSSNGLEVSRCVDGLKRLKDFPVTGDVLLRTNVHKRLRHLRQHNKEKIRLLAKWVLEIWSKKIKEHLSRKGQENSGTISSTKRRKYCSSNIVKSVNDCMQCESEISCKIGSRKLMAVEEKDFKCVIKIRIKPSKEPIKDSKIKVEALKEPIKDSKEDHQETIFKCNDASRNKIREVLLEALLRVAEEVSDDVKEEARACDPVAVAVLVESEMFKKMGPFNGAKKLKYRSIIFNVKDPKNPDLRRKLLLGEVKPERLITMSAEEMASHKRQCENRQIKEKGFVHQVEKSMAGETSEEIKSDYDEARWLDSLW